jgi:YfiR/HmsC-like
MKRLKGRDKSLLAVSVPEWRCVSTRLIRIAAVLVALISFASSNPPSLDAKASEYEVRAAYLYNFAKFIEWPPGIPGPDSEPFRICILGDDSFESVLNSMIAGETVKGRKVEAKSIARSQEAPKCQILFIGSSQEGQLKAVFAGLGRSPILTVSDIPQFSQHGGMIEFTLDDNRVRFEVNLLSAREAGLAVSSELLKVATVVRREPQSGD